MDTLGRVMNFLFSDAGISLMFLSPALIMIVFWAAQAIPEQIRKTRKRRQIRMRQEYLHHRLVCRRRLNKRLKRLGDPYTQQEQEDIAKYAEAAENVAEVISLSDYRKLQKEKERVRKALTGR